MIAELTWWYGVDAGQMTRERQLGLYANLRRMQSQQAIIDGKYDADDYEQVYDLYMTAYGSEDLARRARLQSMQRLVRQETEAARQAMGGR